MLAENEIRCFGDYGNCDTLGICYRKMHQTELLLVRYVVPTNSWHVTAGSAELSLVPSTSGAVPPDLTFLCLCTSLKVNECSFD